MAKKKEEKAPQVRPKVTVSIHTEKTSDTLGKNEVSSATLEVGDVKVSYANGVVMVQKGHPQEYHSMYSSPNPLYQKVTFEVDDSTETN